jgi:lysophospholipase L1-like esterase
MTSLIPRILAAVSVFLGSAGLFADPASGSDPFWPVDGVFPGKGRVSSWTGFREHNALRRALFTGRRQQDKEAIVFVGDSLTESWSSLEQDFAHLPVKTANRGVGGDTTPSLLYRLDADVLDLEPRALVLLIGSNDLGEHTTPADIADNLRTLLGRIRARFPRIPIAWCLVMPREPDQGFPERVRELNGLIHDLATADPNVTIVDTFAPLARPDGSSRPRCFEPDRLHLNDAGYAVWRDVLRPVVDGWHLK